MLKMILTILLMSQALPTNRMITNYLRVELVWTYVCTLNCPVQGFYIQCRPIESDIYTNEIDVASPAARRYLIGLTIDDILNKHGIKNGPDLYNLIACQVTPYNANGAPYDPGGPNPMVGKAWFESRS